MNTIIIDLEEPGGRAQPNTNLKEGTTLSEALFNSIRGRPKRHDL